MAKIVYFVFSCSSNIFIAYNRFEMRSVFTDAQQRERDNVRV